jgi:hypothetical protein
MTKLTTTDKAYIATFNTMLVDAMYDHSGMSSCTTSMHPLLAAVAKQEGVSVIENKHLYNCYRVELASGLRISVKWYDRKTGDVSGLTSITIL